MTKSATREAADKATFTQAEVTAKDTAARAGRKNLILNGSMQISQRGDYTTATTMSNGSYYQDRWTAVIGVTTSTQTKSTDQPNGQVGKSIRVLASSASSTHQCAIDQRVENPEWLAGRTLTFSVWMKSNTNQASLGHYNNQDGHAGHISHSGGGGWEKLTVTHTVNTAALTDFRMRIGMSQSGNATIASGDYFEVTEAQLELGSVATDFEHRSYGEILADCQRFYQKLGGTAYQAIGFGKIYAAGQMAMAYVGFNTPMRTSPSVTEGGNGLVVSDRVAYDDTVTSITGVAAGTTSLYAQFNTGTTRSDRHPVIIACKNGTSGWLNLDAEL
jgi:hypothetical protein|tara:strand:+ start:247 stop:1239 length:993 start_codon:yes stop_codon:yes gene_type:complete